MGYRIRILSPNSTPAPLQELVSAAEPAMLESDEGVGNDWEALILKHPSGVPIAFIEKNPVLDGELGKAELAEFAEEVGYYKPDSAAQWLLEYFQSVKIIYAFQLLHGTDVENGFDLMHGVFNTLWRRVGGILQADQEGFSNLDGNTILWQFSDDVEGPWNVGVLGADGRFVNFEIDLGNHDHRESFWRGEIPAGAKLHPNDSESS